MAKNPNIPKNDRMEKFLKNIDFKELKNQKSTLILAQAKMEKSKLFNQKDWDAMEGIINLIDSFQDIAVDEYGYPERTVFKLTRKK